jgi:hypothetical protein
MFPQFTIFHIITLILISPLLASAQEDGIIAQQGCNSTCGEISIPFPFGMKEPHCYAHKWFEIECKLDKTSHIHKPYLKSLNLEVRDFDYDLSMVEIMNPIYRSNCKKNKSNKTVVVNLSNSPFVYSQDVNTFLAVGCNKLAFLESNGTTVGGCVSICDDNNNNFTNFNFRSDSCNGKYCCETSLPLHLSEYNTTFRGLREQNSDDCSYALIVSKSWLSLRRAYTSPFYEKPYYLSGYYDSPYYESDMSDYLVEQLNKLKSMEYAPAVFEWEILNDMLINSTFQLPSKSNCYHSNVTSLSNRTTGRKCKCSDGYGGNPYVAGGCTGFFNLFHFRLIIYQFPFINLIMFQHDTTLQIYFF